MADTTQRLDIGFIGGGAASATVSLEEWNRLQAAFSSGDDAVVELAEASATIWVRASQIAWARLHTRESRVGF
jgi:hypothetical protein